MSSKALVRCSIVCMASVLAAVSVRADVTAMPGDARPQGSSYIGFEHWGGTWSDAEKTHTASDGWMCWAAASSNALEYTGWGDVGGLSSGQGIFNYYKEHWTNKAAIMQFGWQWWFSGNSDAQGQGQYYSQYSGGGGFYPALDYRRYYHENWNTAQALPAIDEYLRAGDAVTLACSLGGNGGHAITAWGVNYDPNNPSHYYGIWVTDSDDFKNGLRYFPVAYDGGKWYVEGLWGTTWSIMAVEALSRNASDISADSGAVDRMNLGGEAVPLPPTVWGGIVVLGAMVIKRVLRRV